MRAKIFCPKCGALMSLKSQGMVNRNLQKKDSKDRWQQIKQPPTFRMVFRCKGPKCDDLVFEQRSKSRTLQLVNRMFRKFRMDKDAVTWLGLKSHHGRL